MRLQSKISTRLAVLLVLALTALILVAATGCAADTKAAAKEPGTAVESEESVEPEDDTVPVSAFPLQRGRIESILRYSADLEAESEVKVYSQASRLVTRLLVEEGQRVTRGDLLVELQNDEQRTAVSRVESQLAKAHREHQRQERLWDQELISEQAFNETTYELEQLDRSVEKEILRKRSCLRLSRQLPGKQGVCDSAQPVANFAAELAAAIAVQPMSKVKSTRLSPSLSAPSSQLSAADRSEASEASSQPGSARSIDPSRSLSTPFLDSFITGSETGLLRNARL